MILITGASGNLGRLVVDQLAEKVDPSQIVATARSVEKIDDMAARGIQVRRLDYTDADSIIAALDGVDQVLLISSSDVGNRVPQHKAVIEAAAASGVSQLAYTSLVNAHTSTMFIAGEHLDTEQLLVASDLTTSLLRNSWYLENYSENLAPTLAKNALIGAGGDGRRAH